LIALSYERTKFVQPVIPLGNSYQNRKKIFPNEASTH